MQKLEHWLFDRPYSIATAGAAWASCIGHGLHLGTVGLCSARGTAGAVGVFRVHHPESVCLMPRSGPYIYLV